MANPVAIKTGVVAPVPRETGGAGTEKTGKSRFDQVREAVRERETAAPAHLPPQVTQISAEQKRALETQLRKRLDQTRARTPKEFFRGDVAKVRNGMQDLSRRVEALPKTSAFEPIRTRFAAIESQFRDSGRMLDRVNSLDSPRDLLKVQLTMYHLTQNIEIVSKVVEQVNSGVKQILQTQL